MLVANNIPAVLPSVGCKAVERTARTLPMQLPLYPVVRQVQKQVYRAVRTNPSYSKKQEYDKLGPWL